MRRSRRRRRRISAEDTVCAEKETLCRGGEGGEGLSGGAAGPDTRMAPLSGENFRKYSKAKSIERGVLIIINKAGV